MRRNFKFLQNTDEEKSEILHICQIQNFSTWEMWINLKFLHIMCRVFIQNIHFFLPTFCFEATICVTHFNIHLLLFTLFNFLGEQSIFFRYTMGPGGYEVECTACGSRLQVKGKGNLCRFVAIYAVLSPNIVYGRKTDKYEVWADILKETQS